MAINQKCETVLLPDTPATANVFKSHDVIAEALAALIREERVGRTIGLQGGWGAGKTTVSELLKRKLDADAIAVVDFNAWAHEGDPLRRTFFEATVRALHETEDGKGWIRADDWKAELDELAQRRAVEERRAVPAFSLIGKLVIIALFLVPLGGALFGQALRENVHWWPDTGLPVARRFLAELFLGILFSVAPLIAGLIGLGVERRRVKRQARASSVAGALPPSVAQGAPEARADDLWSLLFVKTPNYSRTEVVKTPNPTSIEFEDKFNKLMGEVFKVKDRKVVLVLDNLDRVAAKDALEIWATLQTFFQSATRFPSLWVIILYDLQGLRQLWEKDGGSPQEMALSFLDKTFAARFEVPPPLVSDWHGYLLDNLDAAFPKHYAQELTRRQAEFHDVYRVYSAHLAQRGKLPTPRELKLFVNQIGVLHRQREDDDSFPLSLYAYFTLLMREKSADQIRQALLEGGIPPQGSNDLYGPQPQSALAALLFNVDIATAQQLLLKGEIQKALVGNDVASLQKLHATCANAGFWEVLETVAAEFKESQPPVLARIAVCLQASNILTDSGQSAARVDPTPMRGNIISDLSEAAKGLKSWEPFDAEVAKGMIAILQLKSELPLTEALLGKVAALLIKTQYGIPTGVRSWAEGARLLYDYLASHNQRPLFETNIVAPLIKPLQAPGELPVWAASTLLEALCELERFVSPAPQWLGQLVADGALQRRWGVPLEPSDNRDFTWAMYVLWHVSPGTLQATIANTDIELRALKELLTGTIKRPEGVDVIGEVVAHLAEILIRFRNSQWLFNLLQAQPQSEPFVALCLDRLAEQDTELAFYSPDTVLQHFPVIHRLLPQATGGKSKIEMIVERLVKEPVFIAKLCATRFEPELGSLYLYVLEAAGATNSELVEWLENGMLGLSKDDWLDRLRKPVADDLPFVLYKLDSRRIQDELSAYKDALLEVAKDMLTEGGDVSNAVWKARLNSISLLTPLGDGRLRDEMRKELLDLAANRDGAIHPDFLKHFVNEIVSLDMPGQDSVIEQVFSQIIKNRDPKLREWMKEWLKTGLDALPAQRTGLGSAIIRIARNEHILA